MILYLGSAIFKAETASGGGTPAWGTEMGQGEGYRFNFDDYESLLTALVYNSIPNPGTRIYCPLGKGGNQASDYEFVVASKFNKIFVNGKRVNNCSFVLLVVKKLVGQNHVGRRTLKYNPRITLDSQKYNDQCFELIAETLGVSNTGSWFISEICSKNQDELHFTAHILDEHNHYTFSDSKNRSYVLASKIKAYAESKDVNTLKRYEKYIAFGTLTKAYLPAMRTKPFLLFAGISGTGKSRIVKQLAFESCPDIEALRKDPTSPGNYELIEVKPNWHDSTEVLGYESEIGTPHYVLTPFVKFLVKAMLYEDKAPFFVCMDEMNLAPVEQYFAEFLSVLESRKLIDGKIKSEPLIKGDIFVQYEDRLLRDLFNLPKENMSGYNNATQDLPALYGEFNAVYEKLKAKGLRIPSNLIVVGTVNMDETTHQFSRKVIDRAMTIEMNIEDAEKPFQDFFNGSDALHYYDSPQPPELFLPKVVQAADALTELKKEDAKYLKYKVPQLLFNLNQALDGTPFKIAYRVQNELVLYFYALRQEQPEAKPEALLVSAMDAILMMKVLPRIEGDEDLLEKPLKALAEFTAAYPQASKKVAEMQQRLPQAHFTSFWP